MHDNRVYDAEGKAAFVGSVIRAAERARDDFFPAWREAWENYMVRPLTYSANVGRTDDPLGRGLSGPYHSRAGRYTLKDPQSHEVVESLLAETTTQLFPEDGYVKARPTGGEDYPLAEGVNRIIESVLGIDRHQTVLHQWLKDAFVTGTGVMFGDWEYEEDYEIIRTVSEVAGFSESQFARALYACKDDVRFENVDLLDFYPVPGADTFQDLKGAARRVEMFARDIRGMVKAAGKDAGFAPMNVVEGAIEQGFSKRQESSQENEYKEALIYDYDDQPMSEFEPVAGFEYWGEVPWAGTSDDPIKDGSRRRRLLVINGVLVQEQDWPLKTSELPFFGCVINPVGGRLYGLSPLEVIRFDQDIADVIKQMLVRAVVKSVNPPHVVNSAQAVNPAKVARFDQDSPIIVNGDARSAISQAPYAPPIGQAHEVYQGLLAPHMSRAAGAQGGVTGQGLGSKRLSASEAQGTFRSQFARPNMVAQLIEKAALPSIGRFILNQYALNVDNDAALRERFGDDFPISLQDLQRRHQVRFVGGRREHDRLSKATAMERFLGVVSQVPEIRAQVPWAEFIKIYTKAIDLPDLVALIGQNEVLAENMALQQALSQFSDGGRQGVSQPPGSIDPAELEGGLLQ